MEKRNFILPLHKACSTSTKELRPIFKSIFLVNGYDEQLVVVMPKIIETTLFGDNDKQGT